MYAEFALKLSLVFIDYLIKDQKEREEVKRRLMVSTSKYHKGVLDSSILRREWDELTRAFETPQKG